MASQLPLQFLRPMSLPRAATLHKYLGVTPSLTVSQLRNSSTSTSSSPTTSTLSPSSTAAPTSTPTPTPASPASPLKPYLLLRTPSNKLPIYHLSKRGGNKKLTRVRKIEGDVNMLRQDLQKELGMGEKDVVVNQLTRQVIVKGHMKPQIEKFFLGLQQ
ncbi:mitochondrial large subunit ribosomal protein-domain-containing protein [Leptodontidium sp. MPI-SDFR-AT-0119]|nr:mitochondrial large subunit ribosomal protein-domain-containing protein [Leptodontidium sp. MPI-SDFR-AT-0119]